MIFRRSQTLLLTLTVIFAGLCWTSPSLRAQPKTQTPPSARALAKKVDAYYNHLRSLRADFTESYHGMGISRQEQGTLLLRKPGKMRWNYGTPAGKVFILDGKYSWFYSPGDAQAERVPVSKLDDIRSPLRFLLGHTRLEKELQGLTLSSGPGGLVLSGAPAGQQNRVAEIRLGVTPEGQIQSISIREVDGTVTDFHFSNAQPNVQIPSSEFVFHAPAGVPVVDGLPPV
jgi:outer membrane lipoprotein carrier protein